MTMLFQDNFNGSGLLLGHISDSGHAWTDPHPEWENDPLSQFTLSGGVMTFSTAITSYANFAPIVSSSQDFRVEIDCAMTAELGSSQSIDFAVIYGMSAGVALNSAVFSFSNFNGDSNRLYCYAYPYGASASSFGPIAGDPGVYTLAVERVGNTLKMDVNGVTRILLEGNPSQPVGSTPYIEFQVTMPDPKNYLTFSAIRLSTAVAPSQFWTKFVGAQETI